MLIVRPMLATLPNDRTAFDANWPEVYDVICILCGFDVSRPQRARDSRVTTREPSLASTRVNTRQTIANVFWGLTAAAAVTTGVVFYFEGRPVTVAPVAGGATGFIAAVRY